MEQSNDVQHLLEKALQQLLEALIHGTTSAETLAEVVAHSLLCNEVLAVRLDLVAPYPLRLTHSDDPALAQALGLLKPRKRSKVLVPHANNDRWPRQLPLLGSLVVMPLPPRTASPGVVYLWLRDNNPQPSAHVAETTARLGKLLLLAGRQICLYERLKSMRALQRALLEVGASLDVNELKGTVLSIAKRIFGSEHAWILTYDEASGTFTPSNAAYPFPSSALPVLQESLSSRESCSLLTEERMAFASSAIIVGAHTFGAVLLQRPEPFDQHELDLLNHLALSAGQGLRNARIYQDAQETSVELRSALEELIQAERLSALGEIARGMAHEFNNLLTIISSHSQFLLETATEEQMQELEEIRTAVREGTETLERLREFTRAAIENTPTQVLLNTLVVEARQLVEPLLQRLERQRGVTINIELQLEPIDELAGNPGELRQMIVRVLHNSLDALPEGGIIWISTWQDSEVIGLQIRDNGVGMPEEVRRRVFDPFFTTKALRGTGLGLSMAYGIVRRHRGTIEVESIPDEGTTFTIRLPHARHAPC